MATFVKLFNNFISVKIHEQIFIRVNTPNKKYHMKNNIEYVLKNSISVKKQDSVKLLTKIRITYIEKKHCITNITVDQVPQMSQNTYNLFPT